jgi:hypothetical protein
MCGLGDTVKSVGEFGRGFVTGVAKGLGSTFEGLCNMVVHPLDTLGGMATMAGVAVVGYAQPVLYPFMSPEERLQKFDGFFGTNLAGVNEGLKQSLEETGDKFLHGTNVERGEVAGQAVEFIAELIVGTKGAGAAMKSVKAGSMGGKTAKVAKVANKAADIAKSAGGTVRQWTLEKLPKGFKGIFGKKRVSTKPKNAPNIEKWKAKGGKVELLKDGTWKYTDWEGNIVKYKNGYPDFSPYARQNVDIGKQSGNHTSDYAKAEELSKLKPPKKEDTSWHHHEDGKTMQEVPTDIHKNFTHRGGVSEGKKSGKVTFEKK